MNYRKNVAEGRSLVKRSEADQWRLAELTAEVLANGRTTREWGADIGISHVHASYLAKLWKQYGGVNQVNRPTFANAYAEAKVMPVDRRERRENEAVSILSMASPERRVEVIT